MKYPSAATEAFALARGVEALAPGLAWLPAARALLVADAHLAYEDVVGGALPLWSTAGIVATLALAVERTAATEIVFLGDVVHGAQMSEGARRTVRDTLAMLRTRCRVTLVAGNHEGRSRAFAVLGETVDACERDGWLLVHGDGPAELGRPTIIGHIHPSLRVGGAQTAPAFAASDRLVVVPALTPYSTGLDVLGDPFRRAIAPWNVTRSDMHVVGVTLERLYPFGTLTALHAALRRPEPPRVATRFRRRHLRADR